MSLQALRDSGRVHIRLLLPKRIEKILHDHADQLSGRVPVRLLFGNSITTILFNQDREDGRSPYKELYPISI
jgi:hypothetical protein